MHSTHFKPDFFFSQSPHPTPTPPVNVYNFSSYTLTEADISLLSKALSFAPTPRTSPLTIQFSLLRQYDDFMRAVRRQYDLQMTRTDLPSTQNSNHTMRPMKFLRAGPTPTSPETEYCTNSQLESWLHNTKDILNRHLPHICTPTYYNLTTQQFHAIRTFKQNKSTITIKPADKHLGTVLLNTDDYIELCLQHLTDTDIYRATPHFPDANIRQLLTNLLIHYKTALRSHSKALYMYLQPRSKHRIPIFYGLPKVHKSFTFLPPIRPIVSHTNSLLSTSAKFLDYLLQPIAQAYPDYLHNSTSLVLTLDSLILPPDLQLVTIDVVSLYPSIPQAECIDIIYQELCTHRDILIFDPSLIIRLLHLHVNYNYFMFGTIFFQQIRGTAMGAAFSPDIANIFMSVILRRFFNTQEFSPLLLKRYIDDIILLLPSDINILTLTTALNSFHPTLRFTFQHSLTTIDFLDLTIFKGERFNRQQLLDIKTYQKPQNKYQYLHFSSNHPPSVFKGIIIGECTRYVRTNSSYDTFFAQVQLFKQRLSSRHYPPSLVNRCCNLVSYSKRTHYLTTPKSHTNTVRHRPFFRCVPPPQFTFLKSIILSEFRSIQHLVPRPLFVTLKHKTLAQHLVRAKLTPTQNQLFDIIVSLPYPTDTQHKTTGHLPYITD